MTNHEQNIFDILHRRESGIRTQYETVQDIIKYFNSNCTCPSDETTGWTEFKNCNICGRVVDTDKDVNLTSIAADMADKYAERLDEEYYEKAFEDYYTGAVDMAKLLGGRGRL